MEKSCSAIRVVVEKTDAKAVETAKYGKVNVCLSFCYEVNVCLSFCYLLQCR